MNVWIRRIAPVTAMSAAMLLAGASAASADEGGLFGDLFNPGNASVGDTVGVQSVIDRDDSMFNVFHHDIEGDVDADNDDADNDDADNDDADNDNADNDNTRGSDDSLFGFGFGINLG